MATFHSGRTPRRTRHRGRRRLLVAASALILCLISAVPAAATEPPIIEIGTATYIQIGEAAAASTALVPPGSATPEYVPINLLVITNWPAQIADLADPTTVPTNKITARTHYMIESVLANGLETLGKMQCVSGRAANATSDHPLGRACDLMYSYPSAVGIDAGWRAANWLVANQAALGVKYVIWQGKIWNAHTRPGPWTDYVSTAYGCPNPANVTGCHYDHVHVSMF